MTTDRRTFLQLLTTGALSAVFPKHSAGALDSRLLPNWHDQ